eukprot:m.13520 g.13520  ORF g.13520 m.13520 type:complete len:432 (+) comp4871_c0_seq1:98-1393(+)
MSKDWSRSGSFMQKPATGWLHDDKELSMGDGVYYPVKYVGSIRMIKSMRDMSFDDRTMVTREAITRCCESAGIRQPRRRVVGQIVKESLGGEPNLRKLNVKLTITTSGLALVHIETDRVIATHIMPSISFATGGDPEDYDVIGYVAKDDRNVRECHVFECGDTAHDIIATIGQAFELRYKSFLKKGNTSQSQQLQAQPVSMPDMYGDAALYDEAGGGTYGDNSQGVYGDDAYGDLPGAAGGGIYGDDPTYDTAGGDTYGDGQPMYDSASANNSSNTGYRDVAPTASGDWDDDMNINNMPREMEYNPDLERPLDDELWFHGAVTREEAESLLQEEGDFLVRESLDGPGQCILSVLFERRPLHIMLVDGTGAIRTKDMKFTSVSHLINYHTKMNCPVKSRQWAVPLGYPIESAEGGLSAGVGAIQMGGSVYGE